MAKSSGSFDVDERLRQLSDFGDQLEAYASVIDFEMFRPELDRALACSDGTKGGRPPFDPVMMFKILIIPLPSRILRTQKPEREAQNNLGDDRAEFLINDRLSFMRFLGLGLTDRVPDAKTIWAFRERLIRAEAIEALFARFNRAILEAGYIPPLTVCMQTAAGQRMSGQIVDASLVSAPKQRNTDAEKQDIKAGRVPEAWRDKPAKLRQKDMDARWTVQFGKARMCRPRNGGITANCSSSPKKLRCSITRSMFNERQVNQEFHNRQWVNAGVQLGAHVRGKLARTLLWKLDFVTTTRFFTMKSRTNFEMSRLAHSLCINVRPKLYIVVSRCSMSASCGIVVQNTSKDYTFPHNFDMMFDIARTLNSPY